MSKQSYGIICIRKNAKTSKYEYLMVKKNTTYHFAEFLNGKYSVDTPQSIIKLFDNMSFYEKKDIMSMNFSQMWYRLHNENDYTVRRKADTFHRKKQKFERSFMYDNGKLLNSLMKSSTYTADTPWEFPRGRKKEREQDLNAALRELGEETGVALSQIQVLYHMNPYKECYTDYKVKYKNTYFFAELAAPEDTKEAHDAGCVDATNPSNEVSNVGWISPADVPCMKLDATSARRLTALLTKVGDKYKRYRKQLGRSAR